MLTPKLAQILFWVITILSWISGFLAITGSYVYGSGTVAEAIVIFFLLVPLLARISAECAVVVFKIDNSLSYLCSMKEETRALAYKRTSYLRDLTNNSNDADKSESDPSDMDTPVDFDDKWK